jgi:hypothetical protein
VGKASRKKAQRRQGIGQPRQDHEQGRAFSQLHAALQPMLDEIAADEERDSKARRP